MDLKKLSIKDFLDVLKQNKGVVLVRSIDSDNYWLEQYNDFGRLAASTERFKKGELKKINSSVIKPASENLSKYVEMALNNEMEVF